MNLRRLLGIVVVVWMQSSTVGSADYKLDRTRIVKNLATKTPYAFVLDGITPPEELNVRGNFLYVCSQVVCEN